MRRKLTAREWMLLGIFGILAIICAYIMLFYNPTTSARDAALAEAEVCKQQTQAAQVRLAEKQRMERELEELFARNADLQPLAEYDNLQTIMKDLKSILENTKFSLNFSSVDSSKRLVRREISVIYTCDSYKSAKNVLQQLCARQYRCMLNNVGITLVNGTESNASVNGSIVFFEFQPQE